MRSQISIPYPEGSITALAHHLHSSGNLAQGWTPSRRVGKAASSLLRRVPRARNVADRLGRGVDLPGIRGLNPTDELRRLIWRVPVVGSAIGVSLNEQKRRFDLQVSRLMEDGLPIIALPGAALATFASRKSPWTVLHEVDSHPAVHNELITTYFGSTSSQPHLHRQNHIDRIQREIDLAEMILVPSEFVAQQMLRYGKSRSRIAIVPYGCDLDFFTPPPKPTNTNRNPIVLYVGQVRIGKGISLLVEAARRSPATQVIIAGPLLHPYLLDGAPANITYAGRLSRTQTRDAMRRADAFVYPSVEDNFALAVTEALACGLPVVTTRNVGAAEYMGPDCGRVMSPGDLDELVDAMRNIEPLSALERTVRAASFRDSSPAAWTWERYATASWDAIQQLRSDRK